MCSPILKNCLKINKININYKANYTSLQQTHSCVCRCVIQLCSFSTRTTTTTSLQQTHWFVDVQFNCVPSNTTTTIQTCYSNRHIFAKYVSVNTIQSHVLLLQTHKSTMCLKICFTSILKFI